MTRSLLEMSPLLVRISNANISFLGQRRMCPVTESLKPFIHSFRKHLLSVNCCVGTVKESIPLLCLLTLKTIIHLYFQYRCMGFSYFKKFCNTSQVSYNLIQATSHPTIYLELVLDPTGQVVSPIRLTCPTSDTNKESRLLPTL